MEERLRNLRCRFNVSVMDNNYIDMICSTLRTVDTHCIHSTTGALDTVYTGETERVMRSLRTFIMSINDRHTHITLEATLKPVFGLDVTVLEPLRYQLETNNFDIQSKFSVYIQGIANYQQHIDAIVRVAMHQGLLCESTDNVFIIKGLMSDVFDYYTGIVVYLQANLDDWSLQIGCSMNSPSA